VRCYRLRVRGALLCRPRNLMPRPGNVSQPGEQLCAGLVALGRPQLRVDREQPSPAAARQRLTTHLLEHVAWIPRPELLQTGARFVSGLMSSSPQRFRPGRVGGIGRAAADNTPFDGGHAVLMSRDS